VRDDWNGAGFARRLAIGVAGIALVAQRRAWVDIRTKPEKDGKVGCITFLTTGQVEGDRISVKICLQMDFR
jgi:hypothetical protein